MKHISLWVLPFASLSLIFFILLVILRIPFPIYPLISYQDALDLLTPVLLIPIYWILFKVAASEEPTLAENLVFLALAAIWVEGQGIHLAANSISNLITVLARDNRVDVISSDIYRLTYFLDELLGHFLWHFALLGLAALLIYREWRHPPESLTNWWSTIPAGILYGLTLFIITIEGQTVWMGLPYTILASFFGLVWGRNNLGKRPMLAFFLVTCLLAVLCYSVWGLYWGGFPDFSEAGILK